MGLIRNSLRASRHAKFHKPLRRSPKKTDNTPNSWNTSWNSRYTFLSSRNPRRLTRVNRLRRVLTEDPVIPGEFFRSENRSIDFAQEKALKAKSVPGHFSQERAVRRNLLGSDQSAKTSPRRDSQSWSLRRIQKRLFTTIRQSRGDHARGGSRKTGGGLPFNNFTP